MKITRCNHQGTNTWEGLPQPNWLKGIAMHYSTPFKNQRLLPIPRCSAWMWPVMKELHEPSHVRKKEGTKGIEWRDKLIRYSNNTSLLMSPRYSLQADKICTGLLRGDVRRHRRPTALRLHSALTPCAAAATAVAAQRQRGGWRPRRGSSTEQRSNGEMPRVNAIGKSTNGVPLLCCCEILQTHKLVIYGFFGWLLMFAHICWFYILEWISCPSVFLVVFWQRKHEAIHGMMVLEDPIGLPPARQSTCRLKLFALPCESIQMSM